MSRKMSNLFICSDTFRRPGQAGSRNRAFLLILALMIVLLCGFLSYCLKFPGVLYPNILRGDLMDVSLNTDGTAWILTDGSFKYIQTVSRPGNVSSGVRGKFCKTFLYLFDPANQTVIKKITTRYQQLPSQCKLVQSDGSLWQVSQVQKEPWIINRFDVKTGQQELDTDQFISQYTELKPGIAQVSYQDSPDRISLKSKAGLSYEFLLGDSLLLPDQVELVRSRIIDQYQRRGLDSLVVLVAESNSATSRKMLYQLYGSTADLVTELLWPFNRIDNDFYMYQLSQDDFNAKYRAVPLVTGEVYLEPIIVYQDQELAIMLTQDQIGTEAKRSLICVDTTGGIRWTVPPEQLFPEIMLRKDDAFTVAFFIKDKVKGERQENIFALKVEDLGAIGIDLRTGKELWQIRP